MRRRQLILGLAGAGGALAYMLALGAWRKQQGRAERIEGAAVQTGLPLALSQMDWRLTSHLGQETAPSDWLGRPALVFFGFTFCPDVCPTTLSNIADWLETLGSDAMSLTVALITVDPSRDTAPALAEYLSNFDPRILGLTGSADQIARAAEGFRVQYAQVPSGGDNYTMNHSAGVFLFHADGSFANVIDFHEDGRFAVPKIRRILS